MTTETTSRVVVVHRYAATPDQVFDAFLDVETARRFLFATKTGEMITAEIDPRVGGLLSDGEMHGLGRLAGCGHAV